MIIVLTSSYVDVNNSSNSSETAYGSVVVKCLSAHYDCVHLFCWHAFRAMRDMGNAYKT